MAETPNEIPVTVTPRFDYRNITMAGFDGAGETTFFYPPLNEANCGSCMFSAKVVDPEILGNMFADHPCEPKDFGPEPTNWPEALGIMVTSLAKWSAIVLIVAVLFSALTLQLPWES